MDIHITGVTPRDMPHARWRDLVRKGLTRFPFEHGGQYLVRSLKHGKSPLSYEPIRSYHHNSEVDIARMRAGLQILGPDYLAKMCEGCKGTGQRYHGAGHECYCNGWGITYLSGARVTNSVYNQVWEMGGVVLLLLSDEQLKPKRDPRW